NHRHHRDEHIRDNQTVPQAPEELFTQQRHNPYKQIYRRQRCQNFPERLNHSRTQSYAENNAKEQARGRASIKKRRVAKQYKKTRWEEVVHAITVGDSCTRKASAKGPDQSTMYRVKRSNRLLKPSYEEVRFLSERRCSPFEHDYGVGCIRNKSESR